jgi:hypothetical protein
MAVRAPAAGRGSFGSGMKTRLRLAMALALALASRRADAFHSGGVGACEGCHTIHAKPGGNQAGPSLLIGSDPSSTCLSCHSASTLGPYQVFTTGLSTGAPPRNYTPGGDFAWLTKSYNWIGPKGIETSPGEHHGHSVIALDFGLFLDSARSTAPGGTYPSDRLTCISCHDPHGRYRQNLDGSVATRGSPISASGSYGGTLLAQPTGAAAVGVYRLLGGAGYAPKSAGSVVPFFSNPPVALAPQNYNQSERTAEVRVAYGAGLSEWCQNCHASIHAGTQSNTSGTFQHPVGATARLNAGGESAIYNNYVRTGVLTGTQLTSYTSMVPYEEGTVDRLSLAAHAVSDGSVTSGPFTGQENVMCLSCHRAHASGWDHGTRWNMPVSGTITFGGSWPGWNATGDAALAANAQGRTVAETQAAMYDRDAKTYAAYQKVLCNKCHAQD